MPYVFNPFTNNLDITDITVLPPGTVATLSGNSGGAVSPDLGNIEVIGDGTTITVVGDPSSHTLTISALSPTAFSWQTVTANTTMVPNNGYIINGNSLQMLMPASANVGDMIKVSAPGFYEWTFSITQPSTVQMEVGNVITTSGVDGSIASPETGSFITLVCTVSGGGSFFWSNESSVGDFILT